MKSELSTLDGWLTLFQLGVSIRSRYQRNRCAHFRATRNRSPRLERTWGTRRCMTAGCDALTRPHRNIDWRMIAPVRLPNCRRSRTRSGQTSWSGVRVAEGAALEMRCAGNRTEGSNPSRSVRTMFTRRASLLVNRWVGPGVVRIVGSLDGRASGIRPSRRRPLHSPPKNTLSPAAKMQTRRT